MKNKSEAGFSYIDVMIAVVILLVGILGLVSANTGAIFQTKGQEQQLSAKQIATSTMESIMSVKETDAARLGWNKVGNICVTTPCPVPQGIFQNGVQPVEMDAGPDEVLGTADDNGAVMTGFTREIIIRDECDQDRPSYNCTPAGNMPVRVRSIEIKVKYYVGSIQREEVLTTVLTNY
jgi:type II secretory pathway pseudopilin PulG